jgi:hypothetical protein
MPVRAQAFVDTVLAMWRHARAAVVLGLIALALSACGATPGWPPGSDACIREKWVHTRHSNGRYSAEAQLFMNGRRVAKTEVAQVIHDAGGAAADKLKRSKRYAQASMPLMIGGAAFMGGGIGGGAVATAFTGNPAFIVIALVVAPAPFVMSFYSLYRSEGLFEEAVLEFNREHTCGPTIDMLPPAHAAAEARNGGKEPLDDISRCDPSDDNACYDEAVRDLVARRDRAAFHLFERTCEHRHAASCYNLAWMYENGRGVPPNTARAIRYFRDACRGGFTAGCVKVREHGEDPLTDE